MPVTYSFGTYEGSQDDFEQVVEEIELNNHILTNIVDLENGSRGLWEGKIIREELTEVTRVESEFTKFSTKDRHVLKILPDHNVELIKDDELDYKIVSEHEKEVQTNRFLLKDGLIAIVGSHSKPDQYWDLMSEALSTDIVRLEINIEQILKNTNVLAESSGTWGNVDEHTTQVGLSGDVETATHRITNSAERIWAITTIEYQDEQWKLGLSASKDILVLYSPLNIRGERVMEFVEDTILPNAN